MEEIFSRVHSAARDAERPLPVFCCPRAALTEKRMPTSNSTAH